MEENGLEKLTGEIINIIYSNDENGYKVVEVENDETVFIAVGILHGLNKGDVATISGKWTTHATYGEQLKVEMFEKKMPSTRTDIMRYLSSGIIKGIRKSTAARIVEQFGEDSLKIIAEFPKKLAEVRGISLKKAQEMQKSYSEQVGASKLLLLLQRYNVSVNMCGKIYKKLGVAAVDFIQANPYILCDEVDGITFKTADTIAQKMGMSLNSYNRIKSGTLYELKANTQFGHTYLPVQELIERASAMLGAEYSLVAAGIDALCGEGICVKEKHDGEERIYHYTHYLCEITVAEKLGSLCSVSFETKELDIERQIEIAETENKIEFAPLQKQAIRSAVSDGVMVITGGPGTGKTTIIKAIIQLMKQNHLNVTLTAPTGRAAKRMSQVCDAEAKTIHRLLEAGFGGGDEMEFMVNEQDPLNTDVIIVDEMSMVDIVLMSSLLKAVRCGTRLIMVGDVNQLPSVGPGNVLRDIIDSGIVTVIRLNEIFRQAKESMIITNAHAIHHGDYPVCNQKDSDFYFAHYNSANEGEKYILDLCKNRLPATYNLEPFDIQVLSPVKKGVTGVYNLNKKLQNLLNPAQKEKHQKDFGDKTLRVGDKVMQIRNNYDIEWENVLDFTKGSGVFNGDVGYIEEISESFHTITVLYDDKRVRYDYKEADEIELAYCITVHKSQGSEFPVVVMPMYPASSMLLNRNLFYTGVTRAEKLVVLVGRDEIMQYMVDNNREDKRYSGLRERLVQNEK